MNRSSSSTPIVIGIVVALVACLCLCIAALVASGFVFYQRAANFATEISTRVSSGVTEAATTPEGDPTPNIITTPVPTPLGDAGETLDILEAEIIPQANLRELAMRLKGIPDIPEVVSETPADHEIGTVLDFNANDTDTDENFTVSAVLVYKSENAYFFAEEGLDVDLDDVRALVDDFQANSYPTNREFFGSEWNPGVDGDPRLYILYATGLGSAVAGYYSSQDEYSRLANEFSNEKEMFYINADAVAVDDPYLYSTLAHEFQHMIHWYHDANEESWMNEGSSELAQLLNGYYDAGADYAFVTDPDLQLNTWVDSSHEDFGPHYGASYLFMAYFLDRFGHELTKALVADPANGMQAVNDVLNNHGATDPLTGQPITAIDVFGDWVIANYLGDPSVSDGRYDYHNYADAPTVPFPTDSFSDCPIGESATVAQFGADYYQIECSGEVTVSFTGSQQVQVVSTRPYSGRYAFWGHRNDESDTRLTRAFDLTGLEAATLVFQTWYEIEEDWDYAYLVVSTDGGATWEMVETPSGTSRNPVGNNLGWGYTGNSGGGGSGEWIEETVDLSAFAGQEILVRFEYVTDAALNMAGFMVDDIRVPELDYATDFEADDGGWEGDGFVRMDNLLRQEFLVQVILENGETTVERMALDGANQGSLTVDLDSGSAVLVISGTTGFTTEPASYEFSVE